MFTNTRLGPSWPFRRRLWRALPSDLAAQ
jgi:hypothetical protein